MIRAGRGGIYIEDLNKGYAAIGGSQLGDLAQYPNNDSLHQKYIQVYGNDKPSATANAIAMKFRDQITADDHIVIYNPETREYLVGNDKGEYLYQPGTVCDYANLRKVEWLGKVSRDQLPQKAKKSLAQL